MGQNKWMIAACVLVLIGMVMTSIQPAMSQNANSPKTADNEMAIPGLPFEAARMYSFVKKPRAGELQWQQIPWLVDLAEGIRLAKEENRPLLLWVSGDDPLEKC